MAMARLHHGTPIMLDYTPASAVAAGDVVVVGELALVAHNAIAANVLGALAGGKAVYKVVAGQAPIASGAQVYWDAADEKVNLDKANPRFGYVAPSNSASAVDDEIFVVHDPGVDEDSATTTTTTTTL